MNENDRLAQYRILQLEKELARLRGSWAGRAFSAIARVQGALASIFPLPFRLAAYWHENGYAAFFQLLARKARPEASPVIEAPKPSSADVVFINGCPVGQSQRYRIFNRIEALRNAGVDSICLGVEQIQHVYQLPKLPKTIVIFRASWVDGVGWEELFSWSRENGVCTIYDIDDLLFGSEALEKYIALPEMDKRELWHFRKGGFANRQMLINCEAAIVSTQYLADYIETNFNVSARVLRNGLNHAQVGRAAILRRQERLVSEERFVVGYFSGSKTHDRDFAVAAAALREFLDEDRGRILMIVGHLNLGEGWESYAGQIERLPMLDPMEMLEAMSRCSICIAPLEADNVFCEAKSELKYFEAAILDVPIIATPTQPFRAAIAHGENGLLASDQASWLDCLRRMTDASKRLKMGRAARDHALRVFGPDAFIPELRRYYMERNFTAAVPPAKVLLPSGRLRIDWIVPEIIEGGGGHRNILRVASGLSRLGHTVTIHVTDTRLNNEQLHAQAMRLYRNFNCSICAFAGETGPTDVLIATHWTTVNTVLSLQANAYLCAYFVQDHEPDFYPYGADHLAAAATYRKGLYIIASGPWCEAVMKNQYGADADSFQFPIDRTIYRPAESQARHGSIAFFARPDLPRRCFSLGLEALLYFQAMRPQTEINLYGAEIPAHFLSGLRANNLGLLSSPEAVADLYRRSDVGIAFSLTNPSLVPYEMLASGCAVVDILTPYAEHNYGGGRDVALLCDPEPGAIALGLVDLLQDDDDWRRRIEKGKALVATFPDEDDVATYVEALLLRRLSLTL